MQETMGGIREWLIPACRLVRQWPVVPWLDKARLIWLTFPTKGALRRFLKEEERSKKQQEGRDDEKANPGSPSNL